MPIAGQTDLGLIPETVSMPAFYAIVWASTAIAFPFVPVRLYTRYKVFQKLFADDYFVILAYCLLLGYALVWQDRAADLYGVFDVTAGKAVPGPDYLLFIGRFQTASLVATLLAGFCVWSVKIAFLIFFRRLGRNVDHQNRVWWCVTAYNIATLLVWIGIIEWKCITLTTEAAIASCSDSATARFGQMSLRIQTVMDVTSDASILILPVRLLWKVKLSLRKKLILGGIFSLTIFVMAATVTRVVVVTEKSQNDNTWMYTWTAIEMATAIIVVCIGSFRVLFTKAEPVSERFAIYNAAYPYRNDPERRAHETTEPPVGSHQNSNSSMPAPNSEQSKLYDVGFGRTKTVINSKPKLEDLERNNQEKGYKRSTDGARSASPPPDGVHVRTEYHVCPGESWLDLKADSQ